MKVRNDLEFSFELCKIELVGLHEITLGIISVKWSLFKSNQ